MRPKGHPQYDFDPEDKSILILWDGRQRYHGSPAKIKRRRTGSIALIIDREGELRELLEGDWLAGEAKKEALQYAGR